MHIPNGWPNQAFTRFGGFKKFTLSGPRVDHKLSVYILGNQFRGIIRFQLRLSLPLEFLEDKQAGIYRASSEGVTI